MSFGWMKRISFLKISMKTKIIIIFMRLENLIYVIFFVPVMESIILIQRKPF